MPGVGSGTCFTEIIIMLLFFQITDSTTVCKAHFKDEDFKWSPVRRTLKPSAVPSIFSWKDEPNPRSGKATKRSAEECVFIYLYLIQLKIHTNDVISYNNYKMSKTLNISMELHFFSYISPDSLQIYLYVE